MKTVILIAALGTGLLIVALCSGCRHFGTGALRYDFTNTPPAAVTNR